jgi:uncharacterized membrane protein
MKRALWVVMTTLATLVAAYAAAVLLLPGFGPPFIAARRATMPLALMAHLGGGLVALAIGAWQMNARLRSRVIELHRWMGRTYVIAVLIGGMGALRMSFVSLEGWVTHLGFGLLALLWLFTTGRAYIAIRSHEQTRHRRWMIRSYSLTLAAVTLRIYLPLSLALGVPFANAYQAISWLCWVPNIILAEWLVRRTPAPLPAVAGDTFAQPREALAEGL